MSKGAGSTQLQQVVGLPGAVLLGLGSMIGTGLFISVGIGAEVAGTWVIPAILLAAAVAACNGLSSAQLAAAHPVSGGTYEYGYRYLNPNLGFMAGWTFLIAKSASAATAALGFSSYLLTALGGRGGYRIPLALGIVILFTLIVLAGLRRSNQMNGLLVGLTLTALLLFVVLCFPAIDPDYLPFIGTDGMSSFSFGDFFPATALMFVAYTGYGRVATLGEEVREPRRTIPRAVIAVVLATMFLYVVVAVVAVGGIGAEAFGGATRNGGAPLDTVARLTGRKGLVPVLTVGAITAMLGVLLNLILGLSRVLMAMGRRGDMPPALARLNPAGTTPVAAVIVVGLVIGGLTLIGDVKTTWSFSAFAVLIYYGITNFAALRLPRSERLYPTWVPGAGLLSCLVLAFFVEPMIWLTGLAVITVGLFWQSFFQRKSRGSGRSA